MPIPSENNAAARVDWTPKTGHPRASVFGNYHVTDAAAPEPVPAACAGAVTATLQQSIDAAVARCFIHRFLAAAYQHPTADGWASLCADIQRAGLAAAAAAVGGEQMTTAAAALIGKLKPEAFDSFLASYVAAFGHAARGRCPLNEIEYGDIKADPLFQPHRLADLAAFYRAFGLELSGDADERHDHICLQLEFMSVLSAKEAYAMEHQLDAADFAVCRDAQKQFLREHPGRWLPAFTRRLARTAEDDTLHWLAELTRAFIESECARFGIVPGSEDLLLRPVDEAAESMCASCGLGGGDASLKHV